MGKTDQFYAVARGRQVGIYRTWNECKAQVDGFQNPRYKKFASEAEARQFVAQNLTVQGEKNTAFKSTKTPSSSTSTPSGSRKRKAENSEGPEAKNARTTGKELWEQASDPQFRNAPVVYTDGACSSNGGKNPKAGWGVYWGNDSGDNEYGPVYGAATNNRGELIAVEKALEKALAKNLPAVVIKTDSNLLVQSMTLWIHGWKRNGWKTSKGTEVLNQDILVKIDELRQKLKVKFVHVRGHAGIDGNEKADELARKGAQMFRREN